jgi:hypothetical protein
MQARLSEFSRKERSLNQDREDLRIRLEEELRVLTFRFEEQRKKFEIEINRLLIIIERHEATILGLKG